MNPRRRHGAWALAALLAAGCASVPRDAGLGDLQKRVEQSGARIAWTPDQPIEPPSDERLRPLLQGELTADRAVEIALAHNRGLLATLEELGLARADLIAARTVRNPVFDGEVRFPGDPRNPLELGLTQTLIDLFQLPRRRALGEAAFEAARLRVTGAVLGFGAQVRARYYTLQAAQQALAQQRTITAAAEASAELARRQHQAGNISDLDLENEQALYERAKLDLARAELDELQSRERLLADLGALEALPLTLPAQQLPPDGEPERSQEDVEAALPQRLDLALAQAELEAARRALPLARSSAYDELGLGVSYEREADGEETTGPAIEVPIPLFDRGLAGRARAAAALRQAEQRLHARTAAARSEARAARERLLEARGRADYLGSVVVPRRQRILALTQLEYNAMQRGVYDLIRARQGLSDALREQVLAVRDYWLARTGLDAAMTGVRMQEPAMDAMEMSGPSSSRQESRTHD